MNSTRYTIIGKNLSIMCQGLPGEEVVHGRGKIVNEAEDLLDVWSQHFGKLTMSTESS